MTRFFHTVRLMHSSGTLRSLGLLVLFYIAVGCGRTSNEDTHTDTADNTPVAVETYHADNDIAMTLLSVTDALRQGETLDSIDYNADAILTDGTGRPLYTDINGAPGEWELKVNSPSSLAIRNLYLGDLLPEALEGYIATSLGLTDENLMDVSQFNTGENAVTSMYHVNGIYLRFDTTTALTPAGQEGPMITITASSDNSLLPTPVSPR